MITSSFLPVAQAENLGVTLDSSFSYTYHLYLTPSNTKSYQLCLQNISRLLPLFTTSAVIILMQTTITSCLHYCKGILTGLPASFHEFSTLWPQGFQETCINWIDNFTLLLKSLWYLTQIKNQCFYNGLHGPIGSAPCSLSSPIICHCPMFLAARHLAPPPTCQVCFHIRLFALADIMSWNVLPPDIHMTQSFTSLCIGFVQVFSSQKDFPWTSYLRI